MSGCLAFPRGLSEEALPPPTPGTGTGISDTVPARATEKTLPVSVARAPARPRAERATLAASPSALFSGARCLGSATSRRRAAGTCSACLTMTRSWPCATPSPTAWCSLWTAKVGAPAGGSLRRRGRAGPETLLGCPGPELAGTPLRPRLRGSPASGARGVRSRGAGASHGGAAPRVRGRPGTVQVTR